MSKSDDKMDVDMQAKQDDAMDIDEKATSSAPAEVPVSEVLLPDYQLADWRFELSLPDDLTAPARKAEVKQLLLERIKKDAMLPFYETLCEQFGWQKDNALVEELRAANEKEAAALEAKLKDAEENLGDIEVKDALLARAHFHCRIGDKEAALERYAVAYDKTVGVGGRLDNLLTCVRLAIFTNDVQTTKKYIEKAKTELKKGGDWERKNKLLVYEGTLLMMTRGFKEAAKLFLNGVATFTATELLGFDAFIFYTVVLAMGTMERPVLREKVVSAPEVLQVTAEIPEMGGFLNSFFSCDYTGFMKFMVPVMERVRRDRFLSRHFRHLVRTLRLRAYVQFLEPYRSVTIEAMAQAFGVSAEFIEQEVAEFIGSGKLSCKVDRVGGVIESNRPDARNALYLQIIKQGDLLLNRVQKLSRVIDM